MVSLLGKLKRIKKQLCNSNTCDVIKDEKEKVDICKIDIFKDDNVFKIEIKDYISICEYVEIMKLIDVYGAGELLCNCVLWNSRRQCINKGIFYIFIYNSRLYNVFIDENYIKIDERVKNDDITEEKFLKYNKDTNDYWFSRLKHDKIGDTFYTKYYSDKSSFSLGKLELSKEEFFEDVNSIISNLEDFEKIESIIDLDLFKNYILSDENGKNIRKKKLEN